MALDISSHRAEATLSPLSISTEQQLLLACVSSSVNKIQPPNIDQVSRDLDWQTLIQTAGNHGVLPLLYQTLKTVVSESVPPSILTQLQGYVQRIALNNTIFAKELLTICQVLQKHNIRALPFKGPTLAVSVYGNLGLRSFCDLDIWIDPQKAESAISLLTSEAGYQSGRQWHFLNPAYEAAFMQSWREYSLTNGVIAIDLHQHLTVEAFLSTGITFEEFWASRDTVTIANQVVSGFGVNDLLIYLCLHGSKECWHSLKWVCDIAAWMHRYQEVDWPSLITRAQQLRCERRLLLGLSIANQMLSTLIPSAIQNRIASDPISQQLTHTFVHLLFDPDINLGRPFTLKKFWLHVQSLEQSQDQWASLTEVNRQVRAFTYKIFPNSEDRAFLPLPPSLNLLYYFIRPLRILSQRNKVS